MAQPTWNRIRIPIRHHGESEPVPIGSDAAIATREYGDGRLIPLLILDTSTRPDVDDLVRAHETLGPGDASSGWGRRSRFDWRTVRLFIQFTNPGRCLILLDFDVARLGGVVDQIVHVEGVYVQGGRPGDRLRGTLDSPRVSLEVPSKEFRPRWERLFRRTQFERFRGMGLNRRRAKAAAEEFIREWREFGSQRMESEPI